MSFNNTRTFRKPAGKAKWQAPMRPHNGTGPMEYYLEGELREKFRRLFPIHSNRRMCTWFGLSFATLQRFKREITMCFRGGYSTALSARYGGWGGLYDNHG